MPVKNVNLNVEDGSLMNAYTSFPAGEGPFPGIMVFQEAFGVNGHIRKVADRLADEGFVAIAPELFHRSAEPGFESPYNDFSAVAPHVDATTVDGLSFDIEAAYNWLQGQPNVKKDKIAAIGFCLGGRAAFIANAVLPLTAAISFYGGGLPALLDQFTRDLHGPHQFFWGGLDSHIPMEQADKVVEAMEHTHKPYKNKLFPNAIHAFFNEDRPNNYNEEAAKEAWSLSIGFLRENGL